MDQHQIDVIEAEPLERSVDQLRCLHIGFAFGRQLRGHENLAARNAAGAQTLAHAALVLVGLCGVDVAVADRDCFSHLFRGLSIGNPPGVKAEFRDLHPVREIECFIQDHLSILSISLCRLLFGSERAAATASPPTTRARLRRSVFRRSLTVSEGHGVNLDHQPGPD